jgi:hypothetical protein
MKFVQAFVLSQKEEDLEALATLLTERKFYCAFLGLYVVHSQDQAEGRPYLCVLDCRLIKTF